MNAANIPYWQSNWRKQPEKNWQELQQRLSQPKENFYFLYDASLDGWLHVHGKDHPNLPARLADLRRRIDAVRQQAEEKFDNVVLRFSVITACVQSKKIKISGQSSTTSKQNYIMIGLRLLIQPWFVPGIQLKPMMEQLARRETGKTVS